MHVLSRIEAYLRRTDMPATKFGRLVAHDPRLVLDLRNGREPRAPMRHKILAFLERESRNAQR